MHVAQRRGMHGALKLAGLLAASAMFVGIAVGCSAGDDLGISDDELHSSLRTANNLLTDDELMGKAGAKTVSPTAAQIQKFLEKTTHKGIRSVLADTRVTMGDGDDARDVLVSEAIYSAAKEGGINPLELLVRLQLEQSLVGKQAGDLSDDSLKAKLAIAMGCGCPEAPICKTDPTKYTGFYQQVSCAVRVIKGHMTDVVSKGTTSTGWGPGVESTTEDNADIVPENNATAVLYTYTPWAGQDFGGEPSDHCKNASGQPDYCSGASLHTWLWDSYAQAISGTSNASDAGVTNSGSNTGSTNGSYDASIYGTGSNNNGSSGSSGNSYTPPTQGECNTNSQCYSSTNGRSCLNNLTCGCYSDSDCSTSQRCNTATNRCSYVSNSGSSGSSGSYGSNGSYGSYGSNGSYGSSYDCNPYGNTGSSSYNTNANTNSNCSGYGTPGYGGSSTGTPLYDAGYGTTDQNAATPSPTAPRTPDDPSQRPSAATGDVGYTSANPYGEGTSSVSDGGTKKNAAQAAGGCTVGAGAGSPNDLPSSFFVVAGVAAILAGRRRKGPKAA